MLIAKIDAHKKVEERLGTKLKYLEICSDKSNLQLLAWSIKALILSLGLMLFNSMVIEANTKCNHQVNHRNSKSNKISVNEYAKAR